jgi:predicted nuclease of restriction endonuclease-like (RecB) superfamily
MILGQPKENRMAENSLFCDKEYKAWIKELKDRIRKSQVKASVRINFSMLELYWSIGADIVNKQEALGWGSGVIIQLSQDLRLEFPGESGFSETNLRYMKRFYELYSNSSTKLVLESPVDEIQHQVGAELATTTDSRSLPSSISILCSVPWRHHVEIISKTSTVEEALFYVAMIVENGWSRSTLKSYIKSNLYARQGKAPNNFKRLLPMPQSALAGEMLKDPYYPNKNKIRIIGRLRLKPPVVAA